MIMDYHHYYFVNEYNYVSIIDNYAFRDINCDNITIGENITSIGDYAFCSSEDHPCSIYIKSTTPPLLGEYAFCESYWGGAYYGTQYQFNYEYKFYVPTESVEEYKSQWPEYKNNIYGYEF